MFIVKKKDTRKKDRYKLQYSWTFIVSERSQTQRPHIIWFHSHEVSRGKPTETAMKIGGCQGLEVGVGLGGNGEGLLMEVQGFLLGVMKMLRLSVVMVALLWI